MLREVIGVDPVDDDAALERREADRERAFGHAVAGNERVRIESGRREQLGEAVRQLGANGLGADPGDAPRAQVVVRDVLGTNPARAKLVAERRAERDGRLRVGHQLEPAPRAHREIARVEIVDRALRRHRGQHAADETHVVVERQPRDAAVVGLDVEAVIDHAGEIAEHRVLRDDDAARKARAARRVLQVCGFGRAARLQCDLLLRQLIEVGGRAREGEVHAFGGLAQETQELARRRGDRCPATDEQAAQPGDVGGMASEIRRCRQRHRNETGVLAREEEAQEIRAGLRDHRDARAALERQRQKPPGELLRLLAQHSIRKHRGELAAAGVEVRARLSLGGVIQRVGEAREIGAPKRQRIHGRRHPRRGPKIWHSIQFDSPRGHPHMP